MSGKLVAARDEHNEDIVTLMSGYTIKQSYR
jgi:hypothetical protein